MLGTWSPEWCQHVEGFARPRSPDADSEDPLLVDMRCTVCGGFWRAYCYSGAWNRRVVLFALAHYHCWYAPVP